MSIGPFCSLCGGIFRYYRGHEPPAGPLFWATLARSVRGPNRADRERVIEITGLGYIVDGRVVARLEYDASYADATTQHDLETHELMFRADDLRAFGFHEFCWQSLLYRIAATKACEPDPRRVGSLLFHVLHSTPWARHGALIPDHSYYGAINLRQTVDGRSNLMADPDQPLPKNNRSLPELGVDPAVPLTLRPSSPSSYHDVFQNLPEELIHMIFVLLPSHDVCSARLSSRRLAILATPGRLPSSFWASRFLPNREMGFVSFITNSSGEQNRDWLRTYFECKLSIKTDSSSKGFRNRRRIWRCIGDFSTIVSALLAALSYPPREKCPVSTLPIFGKCVSCPELPRRFTIRDTSGVPIKVGVRLRDEYEYAVFLRSGNDHEVTKLQISSISLESGEYISGIRISVQSPDGQSRITGQSGLFMPSNLASISLEPGDSISSIDVFISVSGIHCLKFFITKYDGQTHVRSAGNARYAAGLVAMTRLVPDSAINGFRIGFDLYKVVSIQLIEDVDANSNPGMAMLWNPQLPSITETHELTALTVEPHAKDSSFLTNIYIPLGGPDGSRLSSLCAVTAFFHGRNGIYGLKFTYDEGDSVLYGSRETRDLKGRPISCVQQTVMIAGSNAERIIQFVPGSFTGITGLIKNIQMRTNYGRKYIFGASDGLDAEYEEQQEGLGAIYALVAQVSAPKWCFQGIQTQRFQQACPSTDMTIRWSNCIPATKAMVRACSWMTWPEGSCFTTASLEGVRRIRISIGSAVGSSRYKNHVSGLRIEYNDGRGDVIIGQWIDERSCFQLDPGERFLEIALWATTEVKFSNSVERFGKISGIAFTTTRNKFELRLTHPARVEQTHVRYRATPFEDLSSITWAFCSSMDDIQVRLKANSLLSKKMLVLGHAVRTTRPFDLAEDNTRFYFYPPDPEFNHDLANSIELAMRYHYFRETFFFQEADESRNLSAVAQVDISADAHGKCTGLAFHYMDNRVIRQGSASDSTVSIILNTTRDEKLSILLVFDIYSGGKGLELRSSLGQIVKVVPDNERIISVAAFALQPHAQLPNAESLGREVDKVSHHDFPSVGRDGEVVDRCVGIWTVSRFNTGCTGIEVVDAGPIYISGSIGPRH